VSRRQQQPSNAQRNKRKKGSQARKAIKPTKMYVPEVREIDISARDTHNNLAILGIHRTETLLGLVVVRKKSNHHLLHRSSMSTRKKKDNGKQKYRTGRARQGTQDNT
jgi:hypothetical protein